MCLCVCVMKDYRGVVRRPPVVTHEAPAWGTVSRYNSTARFYHQAPRLAPPRFPFVAAGRAQKLCRHMLNVSSSFLSALDSHDTHSAPMLVPVAGELEDVIQQLQACMSALAGIVQQTVSVDRCAGRRRGVWWRGVQSSTLEHCAVQRRRLWPMPEVGKQAEPGLLLARKRGGSSSDLS